MGRRVAIVCMVTACSGGPFYTDAGERKDAPGDYVPGPAFAISHMAPGNDEDPALLRARDGSIYVAWYSQNAADTIQIARTLDGVEWSLPGRISAPIGKNFAPSLFQDAAGIFHAVWFRWPNGAPPGKIIHATSIDGLGWDPHDEHDVTFAAATDDWVPSLAANPAGDLEVAFARNTCAPPNTCYAIATTTSSNGGTSWSLPTTVAAAGAGLEHHLPALAADPATGGLVLAWDPYADTANAPWDSATTGAYISLRRAADGAAWQAATDVTTPQPAAVTLYPTWFADHAGALHLAWMSATAAAQQVVEVPLASLAATPAALPLDGYSPRVVATPTAGIYLGAYVAGSPTDREVYVRVFAH